MEDHQEGLTRSYSSMRSKRYCVVYPALFVLPPLGPVSGLLRSRLNMMCSPQFSSCVEFASFLAFDIIQPGTFSKISMLTFN